MTPNQNQNDVAVGRLEERITSLDRIASDHWNAHDRLHESDIRTHERELELADEKFAKANEVREQIERERGTFATRESVDTLRDNLREQMQQVREEAARALAALEGKRAVEAGERSGRATLSTPIQALVFSLAGAAGSYIILQLLAK